MAVCKYHTDRPAVGQCRVCGVYVCSGCSVKKERRLLCNSCANSELSDLRKEEREYIKNRGGRFITGKDFVSPVIIGLILVIAMEVFLILNHAYYPERSIREWLYFIPYNIGLVLVTFGIPFGFIYISNILPDRYMHALLRIVLFIVKFIISIFIGWLAFFMILFKFIIKKKRIKKEQNKTPEQKKADYWGYK